MTDDSPPDFVVDRDDIINQAFENLVHDDLEGFLLLTSIDGDIEGVSFSPRFENPEEFDDGALCQLPLMELLGGSIAEVALEFGLPPEDVADVGVHVTVDHLGVDAETTEESWREALEMADIDEDASQEEYEQVLDQLRDLTKSQKEE
jgi:hypothetical protein